MTGKFPIEFVIVVLYLIRTCLNDFALNYLVFFYWFVLKRPEGGGHALWPNEEKVSRMQCHPTSCQPPNVSRK